MSHKKAILFLIYLFNAVLRLSYFLLLWKFLNTVLIPKPDKPLNLPSSYRPISLLPFLAKLLERLILKRLLTYISIYKILPDSQFSFCLVHSTIHQVHRLVNAISFSLEKIIIILESFSILVRRLIEFGMKDYFSKLKMSSSMFIYVTKIL
jgi:hypothetical protein